MKITVETKAPLCPQELCDLIHEFGHIMPYSVMADGLKNNIVLSSNDHLFEDELVEMINEYSNTEVISIDFE